MDERIQPGSVVQIDPIVAENNGFFGACYMTVTERKAFGAQGYIMIPEYRGQIPKQAHYRAKWEEMVYIGESEWRFEQ